MLISCLVHGALTFRVGFCLQDTLPKTQKSSAGSSVEDENAETMLLDSVKKEEPPPSQDEEELRQGNILSSVSYISILVFELHDFKRLAISL